MTRAALRTLVADRDRASADTVSDEARERAIDGAIKRYSLDRPLLRVVEAAVAPGGATIALPAGWDADFSTLSAVECPPGLVPAAMLEGVELRQTPAGIVIMLRDSLQAGTACWLHWTAQHQVTEDSSTIPAADIEAVACWAAATLLDQLAAARSGDTAPTLDVVKVDAGSTSRDYAARAKSLRQQYLDHVGVAADRAAPAGVVVSFDREQAQGYPGLLRNRRGLGWSGY